MVKRIALRLVVVSLAVCLPTVAFAQALHSSAQKYREQNPSAAIGRSGSATLAARLLLAKDGTTDVEVTTGELDTPATPPGSLSRVQLKAFDAAGETIFTQNVTPATVSGYWKQTFSGFAVAQPFQIQGNIRAIDGRRTDVVVVTASVQKRPDLSVRDLSVPARVSPGVPAQIVATIAELNGQVGARGDCVLYVDGVEVDRANGIWVDSGDSVSCAFAHTFESVGSPLLKVAVSNVQPGDWDVANNTASATLQVRESGLAYVFAFAQTLDDYRVFNKYTGRYVNSTATEGYDFLQEQVRTSTEGWDKLFYYGVNWTPIPTASSVAVDFSISDGVATWSGGSQAVGCSLYGFGGINGRLVRWWATACGNIWVQLESDAGTVTYFGHVYSHQFRLEGLPTDYDMYSEYFYNSVEINGPTRLAGSAITMDIRLTLNGSTVYGAPVSITLGAPAINSGSNGSCTTTYGPDGSPMESCWREDYSWMQRWGQVLIE
jgi:hypothetical protein